MEERDVVVLGGGPGGSTVAACLARRGHRPLLLERETFPRFHIGESLLPRSGEVFAELDLGAALDARFLRKYGARFHCSETRRTVRYDFAEAFDPAYTWAYQVPRADFDELLLRRASALGAEVRERWEAIDVVYDGEKVVGVVARPVEGSSAPVEIRARFVVDATGRDALLASKRRRRARIPGLDKTALFTHVRGAVRPEGREAGDVHIITFDEGWFWLIPFAGDVTSVGAVCSSAWLARRRPGEPLDALFDRTVARSSVASERIAGAERLRPVGALADFSYRIDRLTGEGWLFVGDAAGFLDPLFSTGAHLAMKGGLLAAQAIDRALAEPSTAPAELAAYEGAVRHAVDLFLGVVQGFYKGGVREAIFEERQRTTLRKLITTILAGDVFHGGEPPPWTAFVRTHYPPELPLL